MDETKLTKSIDSLREAIDRSNSMKWTFLLGIIRGIGAVVGATVLAGLALGITAYMFDQVSDIPLVGQYFSELSETLETPAE